MSVTRCPEFKPFPPPPAAPVSSAQPSLGAGGGPQVKCTLCGLMCDEDSALASPAEIKRGVGVCEECAKLERELDEIEEDAAYEREFGRDAD